MNKTRETTFLLLGFQNPKIFNHVLFVLFLTIYILTLVGNLLIIVLVVKVQSLKSPMYFFLTQLSFCDILMTTNIAPNLLHIVMNGGGTISLNSCVTQFYFSAVSAATECLLLTIMSYDRYLAICRPLHYTSVMVLRLEVQLVFGSWLFSSLTILVLVLLMRSLQFCGPYSIDNYFCDFTPVVQLSCSDTSVVEIADFVLAIPLAAVPFFFILFTYVLIFTTIFGIQTPVGKKKAFSTCSSHLIVVSTYYGTLITVYIVPSKGQSLNVNKVISLLYTMGTPFFNPIIYSLRNQEIKNALKILFVTPRKRSK